MIVVGDHFTVLKKVFMSPELHKKYESALASQNWKSVEFLI